MSLSKYAGVTAALVIDLENVLIFSYYLFNLPSNLLQIYTIICLIRTWVIIHNYHTRVGRFSISERQPRIPPELPTTSIVTDPIHYVTLTIAKSIKITLLLQAWTFIFLLYINTQPLMQNLSCCVLNLTGKSAVVFLSFNDITTYSSLYNHLSIVSL